MRDSIATILDSCGFLARVTGPAREKLLRMARLCRFDKGEWLFRQDDPCPGVYLVGSGLVRIFKLAPSGKEHVLDLAGPGATVLEVAAILNMHCPANAEAVEATTTALLPAAAFTAALKDDHALCLGLLGGMALRVRGFVGLLEDIVLRDALSRVAKHLLAAGKRGQVSFPSLKKHLASHLNLTSETLSRCLRQLSDTGVIDSSGARLRIVKAEELEQIAEGDYPRV